MGNSNSVQYDRCVEALAEIYPDIVQDGPITIDGNACYVSRKGSRYNVVEYDVHGSKLYDININHSDVVDARKKNRAMELYKN